MLQNPSVCRGGSPCTPSTFDEAIYCGVYHSPASAEAVADAVGVKVAYLRSALDPNCTSARVPARWLPAILQTTRSASILSYLATQLDCVVVPLPAMGETVDAGVRAKFLRVVEELGQDSAEIERVLADGEVTVDEAKRFRLEILDTVAALLEVAAAVDARIQNASVAAAAPAATSKPAPARMSLPAPARLAADQPKAVSR